MSDSSHPRSLRILVVDDNTLLVEGLCNILASRGFEVVGSAADGQDGVEQAARLNPELINSATISSVTYDPVIGNNSVVQKTTVSR